MAQGKGATLVFSAFSEIHTSYIDTDLDHLVPCHRLGVVPHALAYHMAHSVAQSFVFLQRQRL